MHVCAQFEPLIWSFHASHVPQFQDLIHTHDWTCPTSLLCVLTLAPSPTSIHTSSIYYQLTLYHSRGSSAQLKQQLQGYLTVTGGWWEERCDKVLNQFKVMSLSHDQSVWTLAITSKSGFVRVQCSLNQAILLYWVLAVTHSHSHRLLTGTFCFANWNCWPSLCVW